MIENEKWDHIAKHRDKQKSNKTWLIMICMFVLSCSALGVVVFAAKQQTLGTDFNIEYSADDGVLTYTLNDDQQSYTCTGFKRGVDTWTRLDIPNEYKKGSNRYPVTKIAANAFAGTNITSIFIPTNITSIGADAFANCPNVTYIYYNATNAVTDPNWLGDFWDENGEPITSYGIVEKIEFVVGNEVEVLNSHFLWYNPYIWSLTIGENVRKIDGYCCRVLPALNQLNYYAISATRFNDYESDYADEPLFYGLGCYTISTTIIIGNQVDNITTRRFCNGEMSENKLIVGRNVQDIDYEAFSECQNITMVADFSEYGVVNAVGGIGGATITECHDSFNFSDCGDYFEVSGGPEGDFLVVPGYYEGKPTRIAASGFNGGEYSEVFIEDGVESIGEYAFGSCGNLTRLTIEESVENVAANAFEGCSSLAYIDCRASLQKYDPDEAYVDMAVFRESSLDELKIGVGSRTVTLNEQIFCEPNILILRPMVEVAGYGVLSDNGSSYLSEIVSNGSAVGAILPIDKEVIVTLNIPWIVGDKSTENTPEQLLLDIFANLAENPRTLYLQIPVPSALPNGAAVESPQEQDWVNYLNEIIESNFAFDISFNYVQIYSWEASGTYFGLEYYEIQISA